MTDPTSYAAGIEAAARACERQMQDFLSEQYATGQPASSFAERFACGKCIEAIRSLSPAPPAAPSGWRLVPVEPNADMKRALALAVGGSWDIGHYAWERALAAAPPPQAGETRPKNCSRRLSDEGRSNPESSCPACGESGDECPFAPVPAQAESGEVERLHKLGELNRKASDGTWYVAIARRADGLAEIEDGREHGMFPVTGEWPEIEFVVELVNSYRDGLLARASDASHYVRKTVAAEARCRELEGERDELTAALGDADTVVENQSDHIRELEGEVARWKANHDDIGRQWQEEAAEIGPRLDRLTTAAQAARDALIQCCPLGRDASKLRAEAFAALAAVLETK